MPCAEWKRRIHPDDLGAFIAAADSCHHGGDRFECEYRLLAAGHRWLWVLHRGRVVQRERDGSAQRITGLLLDIDRRKSEEVARSDSESRLATALWGARAAFWQWHVPSNARTSSPLWLAMTGYSRAQWDVMPNPWFSNLHPDDRERVDRQLKEHAQGERDSVEFEYRFQTAGGEYRWMQDRGRAVEWDLQGRPVLVIGVTLDIDAAKHAEAHLRSSESMLETAAWGAGIGLWETNFITDKTRWFNDWCDRHDIHPCDGEDHVERWDSYLHPDEGPEATRRFSEHVAGKAEYYDAEYRIKTRSRRVALGVRARPRGRARRPGQGGAHARRVHGPRRDQGGRAPRQRAQRTRRGGAATNYRRCLGLGRRARPHERHRRLLPRVRRGSRFRARQHPDLAAGARHRPGPGDRKIPRAPAARRLRGRRCSRPNIASGTPTAAGTGRSIAPTSWTARPDGSTRRVLGLVVDITARKIRETGLSAADQRFRAIARELRCVIYEIDAETGLSTGEGVERVLGYSNADLPRPGDWAALVHPDDQPLLKQWFDRGAESMVALQYRIRHRDGHYITLLDSPCVVRDAAGKVVRIVGVAIDISEQASAQEALRASQELLQIVAAGTGDWLILVDAQRCVQFINRDIRLAFARQHHRPARSTRSPSPRTARTSWRRSPRCWRPANRWTCNWRATARTDASSIRACARFVRRTASPAR